MLARAALLRRSLQQRVALLAFVVALLCGPVLVNVWPALGKGQMLIVADDTATQVDHTGHHSHHPHDATAGENEQPAPQHTPPHQQSHHQQHCALCVLAFLGWAPPFDFAVACAASCETNRAPLIVASTPRLLLVWSDAQARAPPLPS